MTDLPNAMYWRRGRGTGERTMLLPVLLPFTMKGCFFSSCLHKDKKNTRWKSERKLPVSTGRLQNNHSFPFLPPTILLLSFALFVKYTKRHVIGRCSHLRGSPSSLLQGSALFLPHCTLPSFRHVPLNSATPAS